jgi:hypothetical protein
MGALVLFMPNNLGAQIELEIENRINDANSISTNTTQPHLAIMNSAIYNDIAEQSHIFGEVLNNFTYPISSVRVYAAVYDGSGNVTATNYAYTQDYYMKPGQKSGFWILIEKNIPESSKYILTSTFESNSRVKPELLKLEPTLISKDPVEIVGTVVNLGTEVATSVGVTGIFYDENHIVVDSEVDYVNIGYDIQPGQKGSFSLKPIMNLQNAHKIKSVALNVESMEYSMLPNSTITNFSQNRSSVIK